MRIVNLTKEATENILENLLKRSPNNYGDFEGSVAEIVANVRKNKDEAIFEYSKKLLYDNPKKIFEGKKIIQK